MGLIAPKRRAASLAVTGLSPRIHSLRVNRNCVTSGWGTALSLQRLLHRAQALLDHRRDGAGDLAGQQVGDPDDAAAPIAVVEDLHRRVVVGQSRRADHGPYRRRTPV